MARWDRDVRLSLPGMRSSQQALYARLGAGQRVRLHQRLGACLEAAYGTHVGEMTAALADHFARGGDTPRAVAYLHLAAENALHRCAQVEAIHHLTRGLELLITVPETPERLRHELDLQLPLGAAWARIKGWSAPEVGQAYTRARELCQRLGEPPQLPAVLRGQITWWVQRAEWQTAGELAEHLLSLAQQQADPALLSSAHAALGSIAVMSWGGGRGTRTPRAGVCAGCADLPPHSGGAS